jgi:RNA-directed DNA polymerase
MYPTLFPLLTREPWLGYLRTLGVQSPTEIANAEALLSRGIIPIVHSSDLGYYLGISPRLVGHMATEPQRYYRKFNIPKKNGSLREILAPRVFLKTVQRYLLDCILHRIPLHPAAVGFRPKMNCATGAERHVKARYLWNIDLKDFFPSITRSRAIKVFTDVGYQPDVASFLAQLCCLNDKLPQGAPTSPALSNIIFTPADEEIANLAEAAGLTYSRYADDLSFSGQSPIPEEFRGRILAVVKAHNFNVNNAKTRLMGPRTRREVTGLTVNEKISVPRKRRRQLRSYFHKIRLNPAAYSPDKEKALGYAAWIFGHHKGEGQTYLSIARSIPEQERRS